MEEGINVNGASYDEGVTAHHKIQYGKLFRKFVLLTVVCSLLPLLLVGWGIHFHYTRFAHLRMMKSFQTQIEHHRKIIELFLKEQCSQLQLIAYTHSKENLLKDSTLNNVFDMINREYWSIKDLGIIDERGNHLAYIGPYDLLDKKYSETLWFKEAMEKGLYISDMFMGFRKVPHFIIAVIRDEGAEKWILRATVDTEAFRSLVENVRVGRTGEVYLLNRKGIYQTSPRFGGKIMSKAPIQMEPVHEGIRIRIIGGKQVGEKEERRQIVCQTWLKEPEWLLVVKQDFSEAFEAVNHANRATLIFLHLSAAIIVIASILITKHMITAIKKRDIETDRLNKQLMQASKLASIGELSAGVAHEINNPLAIILTEKQILMDMASQKDVQNEDLYDQLTESMKQVDVQVKRCKRITQNLLRFSRRTHSVIETVDINQFIQEVIELMEREAGSNGIKFFADLDDKLSPILSDPSQLQQVFLNLITNAIGAHEEKSYGSIHIRTRTDGEKNVEVIVADTGNGISRENIDKIFDPFFTTKPVGQGTGLGLSICYSTMKQLGGNISVNSELGKGSEFRLSLPSRPPQELLESMADDTLGKEETI